MKKEIMNTRPASNQTPEFSRSIVVVSNSWEEYVMAE